MVEILLVEDEQTIADGIQLILSNQGYHVYHAHNLKKANQLLCSHIIDLIILDISLPDGNGVAFAKTLNHSAKILFVSALDDEQTIIDTFTLGSEDYVTKPFRLPILLARVQAIIKRYKLDERTLDKLGHLLVNRQEQIVYTNETAINFTRQEQRLFFYLYQHIGQILTREQLLAILWDNYGEFVNDNTLTVTLKRLRQKIETDQALIETKRGIGYRLKKDDEL